MARHLVSYDPDKHGELRAPAPLNGPSMALGSVADLERILERMDPVDQDCIRCRMWGVSQTTIAELLDNLLTQGGISHRTARSVATAKHLVAEPWDVELAVQEVRLLAAGRVALVRYERSLETWMRGTASAWHIIGAGGPGGRHSSHFYSSFDRMIRSQGSADLQRWYAWRRQMPLRPVVRVPRKVTREVALARLSRLPGRVTVKTAAMLLGVLPKTVEVWRERAGLPADHFVRDPWRVGPHPARHRIRAEDVVGLSNRQAARLLGVSESTASDWRRLEGLAPPAIPCEKLDLAAIARKVDSVSHLTLARGCAQLGVSLSTISRWRRLLGLPHRPPVPGKPRPPPRVTAEDARARLAAHPGKTKVELAAIYGVGLTTIARWRALAGLPPFRPGRALDL